MKDQIAYLPPQHWAHRVLKVKSNFSVSAAEKSIEEVDKFSDVLPVGRRKVIICVSSLWEVLDFRASHLLDSSVWARQKRRHLSSKTGHFRMQVSHEPRKRRKHLMCVDVRQISLLLLDSHKIL